MFKVCFQVKVEVPRNFTIVDDYFKLPRNTPHEISFSISKKECVKTK